MSTKNIDNLLDDFNQQAEEVKEYLSKILKIVTNGSIPVKKEVDEFEAGLIKLQEKYDRIYELTKEMPLEDELSEYGSNVNDLVSAIARSEIEALEYKIAEAKNTLMRFIAVRSSVADYSNALKPFQDEADLLLTQVNSGEVIENEIIWNKLEAPDLFLQALEIDLTGSEGFKLLEDISTYFPQAVQWGLVGKSYFLYEDTINEKEKSERRESEQSVHIVPEEAKIEEAIQGDLVEVAKNEENFSVEIAKKEDPNYSDNQETEIVKEFLSVQNRIKISTPSASSFKKEIIKMVKSSREIRTVLPLMTNLGVLSIEQVFLFGVCMGCFTEDDKGKEKVTLALDMLASKGFLAYYKYEDKGNTVIAYCLTLYCYACMKKESILSHMKGFWDISCGNYKFCGNQEIAKEDIEKAVKDNENLLSYFYGIKNQLSKENYQLIKESIKRTDSYYQVDVFIDEGIHHCCLINDNVNISQIETENILLVYEESAIEKQYSGKCKKIFIFKDGAIYSCNASDNLKEQIELQEKIATSSDEYEDKEAKNTFENPAVVHTKKDDEIAGDIVEEVTAFEKVVKPEKGLMESGSISRGLSPQDLLELPSVPTDVEFCNIALSFLEKNATTKESLNSSIVQSALLSFSASLLDKYEKSEKLSGQLQLATHILLGKYKYTSESLSTVFPDPMSADKSILLAAYLFAMLTPATAFDYELKNQIELFFNDFGKYFSTLEVFKPLYNKLMDVKNVVIYGFSPPVIALLGSSEESETFIKGVCAQARGNLTVPTPKARVKALPVMYDACFGSKSDLYGCMEIIADNNEADIEYVKEILSDYCDVQKETYTVNIGKIEEKLTAKWDSVNHRNNFKLEYSPRDQVFRQYVNRLGVMKTWVEHINSKDNKVLNLSRLKKLRDEILILIQELQKETNWRKNKNSNILLWMLQYIHKHLTGQSSNLEIFSELLYTGIISLHDDGLPDIDENLSSVKYYEPWRNVLKHSVVKKKPLSDVKAEIMNDDLGDDSGLMDNLHQLEMIGKLIGDVSDEYQIADSQLKEALISAEEITRRFKERLELAYTYNQINENEKESLVGIIKQYKNKFFESKDFACWRRFLEALEYQVKEFAAGRKEKLRRELNIRLKEGVDTPLLNEANRLLEEDMNFAVAEEYINRFDNGEKELADELDVILHDFDYFTDFTSSKTFEPLLAECRRCNGRALKAFGWEYIDKNMPKEWTSRLREDSRKLVINWPGRKDAATKSQIETLFICLGFNVEDATKVSGKKEEMYQLTIKATARSMADYPHPIAAFGTQIKSPINVIILYGNYTEKQLVDTIISLNLGGISIVLIDRSFDTASRRLIGEIFHTQTTGQNPFLLIDQVLALYLALHQETERLPALLKCTLPYTTYQPFVRGEGPTADEMFCGRTRELATIIDPNGACVVYGGRQLGKTALLERAESRCAKPENLIYAVCVNIIDCKTEEAFVKKIIDEIEIKASITISPCEKIEELCVQIQKLFRTKKMKSMLLLLDEADDFLGAIAEQGYKMLQPLIDLKRETKNSFKFVLAGLHNVCRAKNATANNGIFGQLGTPLCIKPLSPMDALQLLSRPLRYLGFQIDRYPHLETILTNTNYYPGILQFFGYMLMETLIGQYSGYYHAVNGNPPFTLQDEQLGAVMNSADLNGSIRAKFQLSLDLDKRYFMIARCITMLYHYYENDMSAGSWLGFKVADIMEMASEYNIHCLEKETRGSYVNLLDEMVEMGILSQPKQGLYRLRRSSFVDMIGDNIETLEAIILDDNEVRK